VKYVKNQSGLDSFVDQYIGSHLVMVGLNPRSRVFRSDQGYVRSALEREIESSQNALWDFDFVSDEDIGQLLDRFEGFLQNNASEFFDDLGLEPPARSFSGSGYHLMFAYPAITVNECDDLKARLGLFREGFARSYRDKLADLGVRLDATENLNRYWKVPGTAKPGGRLSRFLGCDRVEDEALRRYLLELSVPKAQTRSPVRLRCPAEAPDWFQGLLARDHRIRALWEGRDKRGGDLSKSGYDMSLICQLLRRGHTDVSDLGSVLLARPDGAARTRRDPEAYVRRTIGKALLG
jgi:hypothetical protein